MFSLKHLKRENIICASNLNFQTFPFLWQSSNIHISVFCGWCCRLDATFKIHYCPALQSSVMLNPVLIGQKFLKLLENYPFWISFFFLLRKQKRNELNYPVCWICCNSADQDNACDIHKLSSRLCKQWSVVARLFQYATLRCANGPQCKMLFF